MPSELIKKYDKTFEEILGKIDLLNEENMRLRAIIDNLTPVVKTLETFMIEIPSFHSGNSALIMKLGKMMNEYLELTDSRYKTTVLCTPFMGIEYNDGTGKRSNYYKNGDAQIYSQYEYASPMYNVFMFTQWTYLPRVMKCWLCFDKNAKCKKVFNVHVDQYHSNVAIDNSIDVCNLLYVMWCGGIDGSSHKISQSYDKLFMLANYEILLNTLSFNGIHADTFTDPCEGMVRIHRDKTIRYKYSVKIYVIIDDMYHDIISGIDDFKTQNIWHASKITRGSIKTNSGINEDKYGVQLIIYKEQVI